jgi:hypothetical protein
MGLIMSSNIVRRAVTQTFTPVVEMLPWGALRKRRQRARDRAGLKQFTLDLSEALVQEALSRREKVPPGTSLSPEVVIALLAEYPREARTFRSNFKPKRKGRRRG